ncbi:hypothetical protein TI39_contig285g00051 [Zymoseptoria brevis]|uniref:C2H2-type domain-containing protein n=1 Tax=Zymoseptoria brevis TaxID=1047168 RepID=A0A0F4GZG9_9PEZI|nr:hypothetical protein TI39_contig285g00051 [Zymoseptoria brevis]
MDIVCDLLKYYEEYGVVICVQCQFAVQPTALTSHLLKHQIYRNERRQLLASLYKLRLESPCRVRDPPRGSPPFAELPVYRGHRCEANECDHVCASHKRMSQHWSDVHGERESRKVQAREAWLQTFFRGNKVRYFEVAPPPRPPSVAAPLETSPPETTTQEPQGAKLPKSQYEQLRGNVNRSAGDVSALDLEAMRYYHHYLTSDTVVPAYVHSHGRDGPSARWQTKLSHEAHRHQFLMYAILAYAALEASYTSSDTKEARKHREACFRYQTAGLGDFLAHSQRPGPSNAVALIAYATLTNGQHFCSLPNGDDGSASFSQAAELVHLVRGQYETQLSVQNFLPPDSDFRLSLDDVRFLTDPEDSLRRPMPTMSPKMRAWLENLSDDLYRALATSRGKPIEDDWDPQIYSYAIKLLVPAYEHAFAGASALIASGHWDAKLEIMPSDSPALAFWARFVPDNFVSLLRESRPAALVIFAHWWWLTRGIETTSWFARGHARSVLAWIASGLNGDLPGLVTRLM